MLGPEQPHGRYLLVVAVLGGTGYACASWCVPAFPRPLLARSEGPRAFPAKRAARTAWIDAAPAGPASGALQREVASLAGDRFSGGVPIQYRRPDAGQVPAQERRGERAARDGGEAPRRLRATGRGSRDPGAGWRAAGFAGHVVRTVVGPPAARRLCPARPPRSRHGARGVRAGGGGLRAGRPAARVARLPDSARAAAQGAMRNAHAPAS